MRLETRTWFLLSLIFFAGAVYFWLRGNEYESRKHKAQPPAKNGNGNSSTNRPAADKVSIAAPLKLLTRLAQPPAATTKVNASNSVNAGTTPGRTNAAARYRLTNTTKPLRQLTHEDTAVLMRNAFVDTAQGTHLDIPAHLLAEGDPGSYIVQARGAVQATFRAELREAGASVVSYIPNNAYLVQLTADGAQQLAALPETQAVLPYQPYYKLDSQLLSAAVDQKPLADGDWLKVTAFPGQRDAAANGLATLGSELVGEQRTYFGPQLLVKPAPDSLSAIARLTAVQTIELYHPPQLLNDLTRVQVGLAPDGASANYLDLSGTNVLVSIADSGIDVTHPDLQGRVFGDTPTVLSDLVGHGTHVAGTIAGDGSQSGSVKSPPPGSGANANFRGMAPAAELFVVPFSAMPEVSRPLNDTYLQETAASTNIMMSKRGSAPMVSNNSWGYTGANEYDSSSASFDAAARDALPDMPGSQPLMFVFAAGNSGNGTDAGNGGDIDSIPSPANAKNVIAVGALEHLRNIVNAGITTNEDGSISTNVPFLGLTDSSNQVTAFSSRGNTGIGTEGVFGRFKPDLVVPGAFIVSTRSKDWRLENDVFTNSAQYQVLKELNDSLAPSYRYESGTSQAAPTISGILALMQEFFEQRLPSGLRHTNSPALMKALLINGARSAGPQYDFQVQSPINYQGWGLVNVTNSMPAVMLSQPESSWPVRYFDQDPTNSVATGQSKSWNISLSGNAQDVPVRVTLVWTDPPGNPGAAIKLVNNLDLVVSNAVTGEIYYGNDIRTGSDFTHASAPDETPTLDVVNNVENVFIADPASTNLVVTVIGRSVNVSADPNFNLVTGQQDDVAQDFALVVSLDDPTLTGALTVAPLSPQLPALTNQPVVLTNGVPLMNQRAGANSSLIDTRTGATNQWNFYVFTNVFLTNGFNTMTNGTNVAFVTFLPPNVGLPRNSSADLDLYVSKDPGLLTLDPAVIDGAFKSVSRGGTESVIFTNAALGDVFYVGVKSEDQQSGEYGFIALSSAQPFNQHQNGSEILHGMPVPAAIPDGSPASPGRINVIALGVNPIKIKKAVVSLGLTHEDVGDLSATLTHNQGSVVLHNHTLNNGIFSVVNALFVYDDTSLGSSAGNRHSDGPGSLNVFSGEDGTGVWMLTVVDNAAGHTGRVESLTIKLDPINNQDLAVSGALGVSGTVAGNDANCYPISVPPDATNLIVQVSQLTGPLQVLIDQGVLPTTNSFSKSELISPPGGDLVLGANDTPIPLEAGENFVCLYNPSATPVNYHIAVAFEYGVGLDFERTLANTNGIPLIDDGVVTSTVYMPVDKQVADVQVAVRIDHPRSSDLVLHLISPQGTRILLAENRGGPDSHGYGSGTGSNLTYTIFTEDTNLIKNLEPIKFSLPPYTNSATISTNPPAFSDSFESATNGIYGTNQFISGWTVTQGQVVVHNSGDLGVSAYSGTNFVELDTAPGTSALTTTFATIPGKRYVLTFFYQQNPAATPGTTNLLQVYVGAPTNAALATALVTVRDFGWESTNITFTAAGTLTEVGLLARAPNGPLLDAVTVTDLVPPANVYVLPEEPLSQLQGERALGNWTLEVWDDRAGPPGNDTGTLIAWQLDLQYGNPRGPATTLTNGVPYSGVLSTNDTNYFVIDICQSAKIAFVTLAGPTNALNLLVNRGGIPLGDFNKNDFAPLTNSIAVGDTNGTGFAVLELTDDPHYPAPLEPGQPLFIAVNNLDPTQTNNYTLQVTFDPDTCASARPVIRLTNDVPYTNIVAPSRSLFDYYVFNVTPGAVEAQFEATPFNGDIGMVIHHGLPLPDLTHFDYGSDQPGITNELIVVTNKSTPTPLTPGDWYIGIFNDSTNPVVYNVRASEILDTNLNIIFLTNAVPLNFTIGEGAALTNYFIFKVFGSHSGVKFQLDNLNANAELLIGHDSLPSLTNSFMSNSASPGQPLTVTVETNAALPDITGSWALAVVSQSPTTLSFTIEASLLDVTNAVPTGTNRVFDPNITVSATNICFSWATTVGLQYELQGKKTIADTDWSVLLGPFIATNTLVNYCINLPTDFAFFQVVETQTGTNPPPVQTVVNPDVSVSTNSVCLSWDSTVGAVYQVQGMTTVVDSAWSTLDSAFIATNTSSTYCIPRPTPFQFFQIIANGGGTTPPPATNGTPVVAELTISSNGLCLTWASQIGTNYFIEAKKTITDVTWTNVAGPITATATSTTECLPTNTPYQFFQVIENGGGTTPPPPATNGTPVVAELTVSSNGLCLSWASQIGTNYFIEAKKTITDPTWTNLVGPITATATLTSHCLPTNTPYQFFQVIENGGGVTPPPSTNGTPVNAELAISTNGICLSWASLVGTNYIVEGKLTIVDPSWTNVAGPITATGPNTIYCLPKGTPYQFFEVLQVGGTGGTGTNSPPPTTNTTSVLASVAVSTNGACLTWPSLIGTNYFIDAKLTITDPQWTNIAGPITAVAATTTHCLPTNTPYRFFVVTAAGGASTGGTGGGSTNGPTLLSPIILTGGGLELSWVAQIGTTYEVDFTTNLTPVIHWTKLTNFTATSTSATFTDGSLATNHTAHFYRVLKP
jgi:subtilisin-like proprotein convertase family protein